MEIVYIKMVKRGTLLLAAIYIGMFYEFSTLMMSVHIKNVMSDEYLLTIWNSLI